MPGWSERLWAIWDNFVLPTTGRPWIPGPFAVAPGLRRFSVAMSRPTPPRQIRTPAPRRKHGPRVDTPCRGRVLVVDDHAYTREMLFTILKTEGYDVALAEDGDQGLLSYRSRPADVVLLDMVMPRKDGLATIRELHVEFPDVTILAMSGDTGGGFRDVLAEAREAGAHLTLRKPLEPWVLLHALEGLVLGRRSQASSGLHRTA